MGHAICSSCDSRFVPALEGQVVCTPCMRRASDLRSVQHYLRTRPNDPVDAVTLATGVDAATIASFAREGLLESVPTGLVAIGCTCPPGRRNSCPTCRRKLAAALLPTLAERVNEAGELLAVEREQLLFRSGGSGMRTRSRR
jgi:hypothetical protein